MIAKPAFAVILLLLGVPRSFGQTGAVMKAREEALLRGTESTPPRLLSPAAASTRPAAPPQIEAFFKSAEQKRIELIAAERKSIADYSRNRDQVARSGNKDGAASYAKDVQRFRQHLAELQQQKGTYVPELDISAVETGSIGRLSGALRVIQVVDGQNAIIRVGYYTFWLRGFATAGHVDGENDTTATPVIASGTETYASADGGSNTLFVLQPIDLNLYREPPATRPAPQANH